ncbi:hypothetical protein J5Y17_09205 [Celeribacter sp. PS-C1]|nr:hypothetical protein [Celeribacter sp. PS-C1]
MRTIASAFSATWYAAHPRTPAGQREFRKHWWRTSPWAQRRRPALLRVPAWRPRG